MKRVLMFVSIVSIFLGISAFSCGSKELEGAKVYIKNKEWDKAKEQLNIEITNNPQSDEAYYWYGYVLAEEGDFKGMNEYYNKSLAISPNFSENIQNDKMINWQKNYNNGIDQYKKMADLPDGEQKNKAAEETIKSFYNATVCNPDSANTFLMLTYAYLSGAKYDEAETSSQRYLELNKSANAYGLLADVLYARGAVKMDKYAASGDKNDSLAAVKIYEQEIDVLLKAKKEFPEETSLLTKLLNAYIGANKIELATDSFKEAVQKDPQNKLFRYNFGVVLLNLKKYNESVEQFKKAIEIDPEYSEALNNLAVSYVLWGAKIREDNEANKIDNDDYKPKFQSAIEPLQKYLELNPEDPKVWDLLGRVYANIGENEKANEAFEKAEQFNQ